MLAVSDSSASAQELLSRQTIKMTRAQSVLHGRCSDKSLLQAILITMRHQMLGRRLLLGYPTSTVHHSRIAVAMCCRGAFVFVVLYKVDYFYAILLFRRSNRTPYCLRHFDQ